MRLNQGHKKGIETIILRMECKRHFECYKSEFEKYYQSSLIANKKLPGGCGVECVRPEQKRCKFNSSVGAKFFCTCPLRVYVAKNRDKSRLKTKEHKSVGV
jgi:hypothetical protein